MPDHLEIIHTLEFVEHHGYALLFLWVFAEQSAIPLPSTPLLLVVGAFIRTGRLHVVPAILCCLIAALIADTIWFELGRRRGRQVLRLVCRLSLEPDSCVRQTENVFLKYGMSSYLRFVLYDSAGALIWSGAYVALGYLFSEQLETMVAYASRMGSNLFLLVAALFAIWIGWKFVQRRRFLKRLDVARITPEELQQRLAAEEELFIIDLRSGLAEEPALIPGAIRISLEALTNRGPEIPRDREIILFCT
jgi:membrane protein DedA with SNARE-associated domain